MVEGRASKPCPRFPYRRTQDVWLGGGKIGLAVDTKTARVLAVCLREFPGNASISGLPIRYISVLILGSLHVRVLSMW